MKLTILSTFGGLKLTKIHSPEGTKQYDSAKRFSCRVVETDDLFSELSDLEGKPESCLIRGLPMAHIDRNCTFRRLDSFEDQPLDYMMLDFDGKVQADWPNLFTETEEAVKMLIPKELGECDVYWQLGSSAGVKEGKYSIHMWVELDKPLTSRQIKPFTEEYGFDGKVQHPIQVHYTASPIFVGGMVDPVKRRSGVLIRDGKADTKEILLLDRISERREKQKIASNFSFLPKKVFSGEKTSIAELVEHRYQHLITQSIGGTLLCDCPVHGSETKKSLHISPSKGKWYCHGCETGGKSAFSLAYFLCGESKDIAIRHLKEAK